ncbi:protein-L-isoaspartate(D-aspartate) O-methyltransferase [Methylorubrum rhodinum]|uniref:Protein-L-isoaspartate O-methyltransferase n=1 Tax=Methylorubrum rhodinum TaxID=29428 RepID=A0A840ZLD4_9HYPH|nr:protein-L-isoaspartate O-methyltransferase [Methylorubrum rhodinum]MBB5757895.1 protein-L-isoaspartate(D-aspartate) O-methyltransferase [Methylorubrum rhodinum]
MNTSEDTAGLSRAIGSAAFVLALRERGVRDTAVLRAMEQVPREHFAPPHLREHARRDIALPLPHGQTMTAPSVAAAMLGALDVQAGARVLEVGTGSGYVTALLVRLGAGHVRSLERYATLARAARDRLGANLNDATVEAADGLGPGGSERQRFDRILINGAVATVPPHCLAALNPGGRLVAGLWSGSTCRLVTLNRDGEGAPTRLDGPVLRLGPMTPGRARVS